MGMAWNAFMICMIGYFVKSTIEQMAQVCECVFGEEGVCMCGGSWCSGGRFFFVLSLYYF